MTHTHPRPTGGTAADVSARTAGIYVLAAHPNWRDSRINKHLLAAARSVAGTDVNDLYSSYPDYAIDVPAEQARVASAQLLVLLHPIHWYNMPALQKLWLDEVLTHGWAYGHSGHALRGKDLWLVASTGGPQASYHPQSYNRYPFEAFLPPYEQTAALCGMQFLPPLILHGAHAANQEQVSGHVERFRQMLTSYPAWRPATLSAQPPHHAPHHDRPQP